MRLAAVILATVASCGRSEKDERAGYGPITPETSITLSIAVRSDLVEPFSRDRYILILGDGTVRRGDRTTAPVGTVSRTEIVQLLDELANADFLNLACTPAHHVDHRTDVSIELVVAGRTHRVTISDCADNRALRAIVSDIEAIAGRAAAAK